MEKSKIIDALVERLDVLEKWRKEKSEPEDKKAAAKKAKVDEEVCPECGGDLLFVEDGIVFCPVCKEYFEEEK